MNKEEDNNCIRVGKANKSGEALVLTKLSTSKFELEQARQQGRKEQDIKIKKLRKENKLLKETLEIMSDKKIIKGLKKALEDFKEGRYITLENLKEKNDK